MANTLINILRLKFIVTINTLLLICSVVGNEVGASVFSKFTPPLSYGLINKGILLSIGSKKQTIETLTGKEIQKTDSLNSKAGDLINKNTPSAKILIDSAIKLSEVSHYQKGLAEAKRLKCIILYYEVRYSEALNLLIESIDLFKSIKDSVGEASSLNMLAIIYNDQGLHNKALEIYNQILLLTSRENYHRLAATFNNIGATYKDLGNLKLCYTNYKKALQLLKDKNEYESESQFNNNLGGLFIELGNMDSALYYIQLGLQLAIKSNNNHRLSNSYESLGDYLYELKNYELALENYKNAVDYAQKAGIVYEISSSAKKLSKTYEKMGNYKNAFYFLKINKAMDDSAKQKEIASRVTQLELEKGFQKERALNEAIISRNKLARIIYIVIIIAVLIIACFGLYHYYQKKKSYGMLKERTRQICLQNLEIQSQAEELNNLNTLKDKLFSIISHDLRSPLSSLVSVLDLTKNGDFSKDEFYGLLNEMHENVGYTANLVENLLKWVETQQKGIKVNPVIFELHEMVQSKILLMRNQLAIKNIEIANHVDKGIEINADKDMIELVIRNLLSNATKYSNDNGLINVYASVEKDKVNILFQDYGVGISPDNIATLFKSKVFSTRGTKNEKGTGLGLMLCKDFLELNGGTISVESEIGKGSLFSVTLPNA